jgi:hypothetical protein
MQQAWVKGQAARPQQLRPLRTLALQLHGHRAR